MTDGSGARIQSTTDKGRRLLLQFVEDLAHAERVVQDCSQRQKFVKRGILRWQEPNSC